MALATRPVATSVSPTMTASRPASTARGGSLAGAVNPVDNTTPINLSEETFAPIVNTRDHDGRPDNGDDTDRRNNQNERRGGNSRQDTAVLPSTGIVDTPSETFAKILEARDEPAFQTTSSNDLEISGFTLNLINQAVSLYESRVNILTYSQNIRGETISLTL